MNSPPSENILNRSENISDNISMAELSCVFSMNFNIVLKLYEVTGHVTCENLVGPGCVDEFSHQTDGTPELYSSRPLEGSLISQIPPCIAGTTNSLITAAYLAHIPPSPCTVRLYVFPSESNRNSSETLTEPLLSTRASVQSVNRKKRWNDPLIVPDWRGNAAWRHNLKYWLMD